MTEEKLPRISWPGSEKKTITTWYEGTMAEVIEHIEELPEKHQNTLMGSTRSPNIAYGLGWKHAVELVCGILRRLHVTGQDEEVEAGSEFGKFPFSVIDKIKKKELPDDH